MNQIENANSPEYQVGILLNIECEMPKAKRKRIRNVEMVQKYLLRHTSKGGQTSAYSHCLFLGVDPDGRSFLIR